MKYEITKGSAKDFEGAPEWALFVDIVKIGDGNYTYWSEGYDVGDRFQCVGNYRVGKYEGSERNGKIIAERRPINEPVVNQQLTTEWDGEGLPPIGCVCEYRGNDTSWGEVKIIGHDEGKVVFKPSGEDYYGITPSHKAEFIPIRAPEDVARSNAIGEMERAYEELTGNPAREAEEYYDLIAAGKIKGVVLDSSTADLKINITTDEMWREFEKKSDMEDVRKLITTRMYEWQSRF